MKLIKESDKKLIFAMLYLFSMFSMHSDNMVAYWGNNGTPFLFCRFFAVIILCAVGTWVVRKHMAFLSTFVPIATLFITALVIFDYYVTEFSGSQFLYRVWWIAYIIVSDITVFLCATVFAKENYQIIYRRFWLAFTPLYLFAFYLCFIRTPGSTYSLNTVFGQGTLLMLKAFIKNVHISFEAPLMVFGNLAIFMPLPFILSAVSQKLTPPLIMIIGFLMPFAVEGYQLILNCGNVDIDDIVLNFGGFLLSFFIYLIIYQKKLQKPCNKRDV